MIAMFTIVTEFVIISIIIIIVVVGVDVVVVVVVVVVILLIIIMIIVIKIIIIFLWLPILLLSLMDQQQSIDVVSSENHIHICINMYTFYVYNCVYISRVVPTIATFNETAVSLTLSWTLYCVFLYDMTLILNRYSECEHFVNHLSHTC